VSGAALGDAGRVMRPGNDVAALARRPTGRKDDGAGNRDRLAAGTGRAIEDAVGLGVGAGAADLRVDAQDVTGFSRANIALRDVAQRDGGLGHARRGSSRHGAEEQRKEGKPAKEPGTHALFAFNNRWEKPL
jgi:hypothetical protein